jgi:phenylalanine-4-hydroxylase
MYGIQKVRNSWNEFTQKEHETWARLYKTQIRILENLAHPLYYEMLPCIGITESHIPNIEVLNNNLKRISGMEIYFHNETIVGKDFFLKLSKKLFPSTLYIRDLESLDYLTEPDIFHDIFGHGPFLADKKIVEIIYLCGKIGIQCIENRISSKFIGRLYWYTIEFGLIYDKSGLRIYGGGIISSKEESIYAITSTKVHRIKFNPLRMMRTSYNYNEMQKMYFVIESLDEVIDFLRNFDINILREDIFKTDYIPGYLISEDTIIE